ncbi:metallophosphoesterase [Elioraea sp.]|uniref:metallophosphoesterase n=1 Tax=Elioraea sp. TaxID=2185103 RepID=UPI0025BEE583|nr:metallophosphoesterase [Elioraea sp.]
MRLRLPPGFAGVRVVGDVHGEARAFEAAVEGAAERRLFTVQLGDLTDHGPDAPAVLAMMFGLIDRGAGLFLLGNHDHKLRRALSGQAMRVDEDGLGATLAQLKAHPDGEALAARAIAEIARAPAWVGFGPVTLFVHGGFHPSMLASPPPADAGTQRPEGAIARALFGQTARGAVTAAGYPVRVLGWVDAIPAGLTVYCGHDTRSTDGRPHIRRGKAGGRAVFMDTGAGKGGHLSWCDLGVDGEEAT